MNLVLLLDFDTSYDFHLLFISVVLLSVPVVVLVAPYFPPTRRLIPCLMQIADCGIEFQFRIH